MKYKFLLPLVAFAALLVVFAIGVKRSPEKGVLQSVLIGKPAPEFNLPSLMNPAQTVSSKTLLGKPYVLNVWATWCVQCQAEHPTLLEMQRRGEAPIIGLNWRDKDNLALQWIEQFGNPYAHIAVDKEGHTAIDFGVYGAPETFLVDARGIVVHKYVGPLSIKVWEEEFVPLLKRQPAGPT